MMHSGIQCSGWQGWFLPGDKLTRAGMTCTREAGEGKGAFILYVRPGGQLEKRKRACHSDGAGNGVIFPVIKMAVKLGVRHMDYKSLKSEYDRAGFVIVRNFIPAEEFQELRQNLDRYIRDVVPTLEDAHAFYDDKSKPETLKQMQHMQADPYFRDFAQTHPRWRDLAEALLGEPATCEYPEWFNKPPRTTHPTPPHQDNYYFNLTPPQVLTIWVALDPVDEENGCLRYIAGSHLRGVRPHGRSQVLGFSQGITDYSTQERESEVCAVLQPGDATIHHGWMIHRADPNVSQVRHRRSFALVFRGASCRRDDAGYQRYMDALKQQHSTLGLKT